MGGSNLVWTPERRVRCSHVPSGTARQPAGGGTSEPGGGFAAEPAAAQRRGLPILVSSKAGA